MGVELDARLALGEIEMKSGQTTAGRAHLTAVEANAKTKGYILLTRKAALLAVEFFRSTQGTAMCSRFSPTTLSLGTVGNARSGSEGWEALDRDIGKSGKDRCQIVAHGDFQPTAAFHDRENCRNPRSRLWAADVQPILSTKSYRTHGILRQVST